MAVRKRQRAAVVVQGPHPPRWQAHTLRLLREAGSIDLVQVLTLPKPLSSRALGPLSTIDLRVFGNAPDALRSVEPRGGSEPPVLALSPTKALERRGEGVDPSVDVLLQLAEAPPVARPDIPCLVIRHDGVVGPAEHAFLHAYRARRDHVRSELVLLEPDGRARVLAQTVSGVREFSPIVSAHLALWKLPLLVARSLPDALEATDKAGAVEEPGDLEALQRGTAAPRHRGVDLVTTRAGAVARWCRAGAIRLVWRRPWGILVRRRAEVPWQAWTEGALPLAWSPGHVYADPFLIEHAGVHHLFCEEIRGRGVPGVISHTIIEGDNPIARPRPVLRRPYHLSYPCVFRHNNELYLIPQSTTSGGVQLYRAHNFPEEWELVDELLSTNPLDDCTVLFHGDHIWLFGCARLPGAGATDELLAFSAPTIAGPWEPHPLNPLVSDARCARPAGAFTWIGQQLVRPVQDCSRRYGGAITFRVVEELTTSTYRERDLERLAPSAVPHARATHTYATDGTFEAIDYRTRQLRARWPGGSRRVGDRAWTSGNTQ